MLSSILRAHRTMTSKKLGKPLKKFTTTGSNAPIINAGKSTFCLSHIGVSLLFKHSMQQHFKSMSKIWMFLVVLCKSCCFIR